MGMSMNNNVWTIVFYHNINFPSIISPRKSSPLSEITQHSMIRNIYAKENIMKLLYKLNKGYFQVEIE